MRICTLLLMCALVSACQPGSGEFSGSHPDNDQPTNPDGNLLARIQQEIFSPICSQCHIGNNAPAGLRLENSDVAHQNLINVAAVGNSDFIRVVPNEPDSSYLLLKLLGDPRAGQRMPLGQPALQQAQIDLVRDWIQQGALPISKSNQSKLISVKTKNQANRIDVEFQFDNPIDESAIFYESLPVFQLYQGQKWLLSNRDYQFQVRGDTKIQLQIDKSRLIASRVLLEIGEATQMPLIDKVGGLVDVDADNEQGGEHAITIEVN